MSSWDIFHGDTLELEHGLSTLQVRAALVAKDVRDEDLARPAGSKDAWLPIAQIEELRIPPRPAKTVAPPPAPASPPVQPSPTTPLPQPGPESLTPNVPLPGSYDLGAENDDVSFPVVPDVFESEADTPSFTQEESPTDSSVLFRFAPEESSPDIRLPENLRWRDDDEDDELDEAEDLPEEPSSLFMGAPSNPAKQWDLGPYDLDPDLGRDRERRTTDIDGSSSSRIAIPIIKDRSSQIALPVVASRDWSKPAIAQEGENGSEDEVFTFARHATNKVEELDLAPMVDVAFQLVLFFMVTATTVLYKTLEVPKPGGERSPDAVAQGRSKSVDDLRDSFIVVEIDPSGTFKIDREPVAADMDTLIERLRLARDKTARKTMLLSAEYATPHRFAVLAIDAANEIGLGIAVAKPQGRQTQATAPALFPLGPPGQPKPKGVGKGA